MEVQKVVSIETVIDFIENHLDGKLELDTVADVYKRQTLYGQIRSRGLVSTDFSKSVRNGMDT